MALKYLLPGQLRFMKASGFDVLMISADGKELDSVVENENSRHIIVPMTRKITPFHDLKCLFQLIGIFRKERPDIVHTQTPKAGLLGMMAAKFCGVRLRIHTVGGLPMMSEKGFKFHLLKWVERMTMASANHVWPNSQSLKQYITSHRLASSGKLKVIGKGSTNGIDLDFFDRNVLDEIITNDIKKTILYSTDTRYLLFVGRLVADKGLFELVNAFRALQQQYPILKLILVGDYEGSLDPLPGTTVQEIESNPSIIHIGWTDDVRYYLHLANYFIFPSHREGFPNVLLQAGAMELPVICSRIAGNVDIISHGETGLIFDCCSEQQMKNAIEQALSEPAFMHTMAIKLKQQVYSDFKRENTWQNILEAYKSLLI